MSEKALPSATVVDTHHPYPGIQVSEGDLRHPKAIDLAEHVGDPACPYFKLLDCRRDGENDVVVFSVEPEVPQHPVVDIQPFETIAVEFDSSDRREPKATALRRGLPRTIHTNVGLRDWPVHLCLFDRPYSELKLSWTAAAFARQLHEWLSLTARGELHAPDQPLEQLFIGSACRLVVPQSCFQTEDQDEARPMTGYRACECEGTTVLIAMEADSKDSGTPKASFTLATLAVEQRTHGAIQIQPQSLDQLVDYLGASGDKFLEDLARKLKRIHEQSRDDLERPLVLVIWFPKTRSEGGDVEGSDLWAFGASGNGLDVGASIGLWPSPNESTKGGVLLSRDTSKRGEGIDLDIMLPTAMLTQKVGAQCNDTSQNESQHVAIGAGAIGSQVIEQLVRCGHGQWTIVDGDVLLPHNVARHLLTRWEIGLPKADSLSRHLNSIYEDKPSSAIVADVLHSSSDELTTAFNEAGTIVDLSASVAVSRMLAVDVGSAARRVACFLSPSGKDSVLLAEPEDRSMRLDLIEMEYYRSLIRNNQMRGHLASTNSVHRYANACRDVSVRLPHDAVVLHASIAARQIRVLSKAPIAKVYRTDESLIPSAFDIQLSAYRQVQVGKWMLWISERLVQELKRDRSHHLPTESGGVLIGSFDTSRKIVYVVDHLVAPADSERSSESFLRGSEGLQMRLEGIKENTLGQLDYVGEWHSHPSASTKPSNRDADLFQWLSDYRRADGVPALMAIVASKTSRWIVGDMDLNEELSFE